MSPWVSSSDTAHACAAIVSTILAPLALLGRDTIAGWLNSPQLAAYLPLLSVAVFFTGGILALTDWAVRAKAFVRIAVATVAGTAVTIALLDVFPQVRSRAQRPSSGTETTRSNHPASGLHHPPHQHGTA